MIRIGTGETRRLERARIRRIKGIRHCPLKPRQIGRAARLRPLRFAASHGASASP